MLSKEDIRVRLVQFEDVVKLARSVGYTDAEICKVLRLRPKKLGMQTRLLLRAIQQGEIPADKQGAITTKQVALWLGKTRGTAIYHLNILRDAGYID